MCICKTARLLSSFKDTSFVSSWRHTLCFFCHFDPRGNFFAITRFHGEPSLRNLEPPFDVLLLSHSPETLQEPL